MTFVAVDVGNTDVSMAAYAPDGKRSGEFRRPSHLPLRGAPGGDLLPAALLDAASAAGIASVVPDLTPLWREALEGRGIHVRVLRADSLPGLRLDVDRPEEVGVDRAVNAWMGARRYGRPLVVVDMGTATTFDAVAADGAYVGGAIAPGLRTGVEALVHRAALLGGVRPDDVLAAGATGPIGRSTLAAMRAGGVVGYAAMVDGMIGRIRGVLGAGTRAVATGGLAALVLPHCAEVSATDPWLTLDGIREACL